MQISSSCTCHPILTYGKQNCGLGMLILCLTHARLTKLHYLISFPSKLISIHFWGLTTLNLSNLTSLDIFKYQIIISNIQKSSQTNQDWIGTERKFTENLVGTDKKFHNVPLRKVLMLRKSLYGLQANCQWYAKLSSALID